MAQSSYHFSVFPENIDPQITSIQPLCFMWFIVFSKTLSKLADKLVSKLSNLKRFNMQNLKETQDKVYQEVKSSLARVFWVFF